MGVPPPGAMHLFSQQPVTGKSQCSPSVGVSNHDTFTCIITGRDNKILDLLSGMFLYGKAVRDSKFNQAKHKVEDDGYPAQFNSMTEVIMSSRWLYVHHIFIGSVSFKFRSAVILVIMEFLKDGVGVEIFNKMY